MRTNRSAAVAMAAALLALALSLPRWPMTRLPGNLRETAAPGGSSVPALEARLCARPDDAGLLATLAAAYMDRARVTLDAAWTVRAEEACRKSLAIAPGNYEALRLRSWILSGQHRFREAAAAAREAMAIRPGDAWNHGALGDALVELGDYDGALRAFQRMADLKPGAAAYARAAYLRELLGDTDGAIDLMTLAARSTDSYDREKGAWYHAQLGDLRFSKGDLEGAEAEQRASLALSENAHALSGLARALAARGRDAEAARLYDRSLALAPVPAVAADYGDLLRRMGRARDARNQFAIVEAVGRIQSSRTGLFDRQVALYLAEHGDPGRALAMSERELVVRKDIYGYDAVAWSALEAGRIDRARETMREALRLGTRDARLRYHAGMIALAAGDRRGAERNLRKALEINPWFDATGARAARRALREIER